jgi:DNA-binding transcriptional ArsR family regulator
LIQIRFSADDLRRTRVIPTLGPYAETIFGFIVARQCTPNPLFTPWLKPPLYSLKHQVQPLRDLFTCGAYIDLISVVGSVSCIEEGIEKLKSASRERLRAEIDWVDTHWKTSMASGAISSLVSSDPEPRRRLAEAIDSFHGAAVSPHWNALRNRLDSEAAAKIRALGTGGVDHLMATLCPPIVRWDPPVLHIATTNALVSTFNLGGRGLMIAPSVFVGRYPQLLFDWDEPAPPVLLYPAVRDLAGVSHILQEGQSGNGTLGVLLGRTRSLVLELIGDSCGTVELARRAGISPAAASEHAAILRDAGLVSSYRAGRTVLHTLTPLGAALLNAGKGLTRKAVAPLPPG